MSVFSCIINFRDNLTKNSSYYLTLLSKMSDKKYSDCRIDEHAAWCCRRPGEITSKISEGYQFTSLFCGSLRNVGELKKELIKYGYELNTDSDAEVALTAYIHFGRQCMQKLHGDFTFIVNDCMRRCALIMGTASGTPVFYCQTDSAVIISSHPAGLFPHPEITPKITADSLRTLFLMPHRTDGCIFDGIKAVPRAEMLKITDESVSLIHAEKACPAQMPVGLRETAAAVADTIGENIKKSDEAGIVLTGSHVSDALLSITSAKTRRLSSYSFRGENTLTQTICSYHSHLPVSEDALRESLKKSVTTFGIPIFSDFDYLLPIYFSRIPSGTDTVYLPSPGFARANSCGCRAMLKNHAFIPIITKTLELDGNYTPKNGDLFNYSTMYASEHNIPAATPLADSRIMEIMQSVPYTSDGIFTEILRERPGFIPVAVAPCDDLPILRRILLEILADENSPLSAFFDLGALLRLCEGKFDFSGAAASQSAYIAYLIKLHIWFCEYKPRII